MVETRHLINSKLKVCSKNLRSLLDRCSEDAGHEKDSNKFRERFRELYDITEIVGMFRYYYLRFFGGYEAV